MLRKIDENSPQEKLYKTMHTEQTLDYVIKTKDYVNKLPKVKKNIKDVLNELNNFVDPSDPDVNEDNIYHAYETAEMIRNDYPLDLELQVTGLIHDIGKRINIFCYFYDKPWSVVGDTYPLGCKFSNKIICSKFFKNNPDSSNEKLNTKYGIYNKNCGLSNLHMSYGHDEYLYRVLKLQENNHKLSRDMMNIIRFHSFYAWHTDGDYKYFENQYDNVLLDNIKKFNKYDLYSKKEKIEITDKVKKYYDVLLDYYFPEKLLW